MINPISINRRTRNKQDKQNRIREAAWQLFRAKGFEHTTTRAIAEAADVAAGTLFLYAKDKNELLIVLFEEQLSELSTQAALQQLDSKTPLVDALVQIFQPLFFFYAQDRNLSRHFIKEYLTAGSQAPKTAMQGFIAQLVGLLQQRQIVGEIRTGLSLTQAALNIFALYYAVLTAFLVSEIGVEEALEQQLRAALELQIAGFGEKL